MIVKVFEDKNSLSKDGGGTGCRPLYAAPLAIVAKHELWWLRERLNWSFWMR